MVRRQAARRAAFGGAAQPKGESLYAVLFCDDRHPCHAHDHWHRDYARADLDGQAGQVFPGVSQSGRMLRPVLALCRHRLGLFVSGALSFAESVMAENHDHVVSPSVYVSVLIALMLLLALTVVAAFVDL